MNVCMTIFVRTKLMLWVNFLLGLKIFKAVRLLISSVSEYGNESETKENKN